MIKNIKETCLGQAVTSKHWEQRQSPAKQYIHLLQDVGVELIGKKLLDVGCARGIEVQKFREFGINADGVDLNVGFIDDAKTKCPDANFVVANAESLPYKNESYDMVFCINTLFYTDLNKSIPELCRILKKGGYGAISYDIEIINIDENTVIHSDSIEHLEHLLNESGSKIERIEDVEERIDPEPFKHKHVFHKVVFKKTF